MQTTQEVVTPELAQQIIDECLTESEQRKFMPHKADEFARMIRAGDWILTHQGIAISDQGHLIDGQHRLRAIIATGCPVRMLVSRNVPHVDEVTGMKTIDAIDRGSLRRVGQQLSLHGIANANQVAAISHGVLWLCAFGNNRAQNLGSSSVASVRHVLDFYGEHIVFTAQRRGSVKGFRKASVSAAVVFAMNVAPGPIKEFHHQIVTGEGLRKKSPANVCRNWIINNHDKGDRRLEMRVVLNAAMKHVEGEVCARLSSCDRGLVYFLDRQELTTRRLLRACGFRDFAQEDVL